MFATDAVATSMLAALYGETARRLRGAITWCSELSGAEESWDTRLRRTRWGERLGSKHEGWSDFAKLPRLGTRERSLKAEWVSSEAMSPLAELGSGCSLTAQSIRVRIPGLAHDLPRQLNVYGGNDTRS